MLLGKEGKSLASKARVVDQPAGRESLFDGSCRLLGNWGEGDALSKEIAGGERICQQKRTCLCPLEPTLLHGPQWSCKAYDLFQRVFPLTFMPTRAFEPTCTGFSDFSVAAREYIC